MTEHQDSFAVLTVCLSNKLAKCDLKILPSKNSAGKTLVVCVVFDSREAAF